MADHRKPEYTICVKNGAKKAVKIEVFSAAEWAKTAQEKAALSGLYRLRINRRWHNAPDGGRLYLALAHTSDLLLSRLTGVEGPILPQQPDLPRGSRVSAPNGRTLAGQVMRDVTWTETDPVRGFDARWYVGVRVIGKGIVMMPADDVTLITEQDKAARAQRAAQARQRGDQ
ncbi:hypothetical protein LJC46_02225 [Desulfovibrio sp. OttesenSCG-928-G15]|nr:hypothetical protein [Desulfovibrio sp. OttesenSCG-928-G15]